jgi:hypothetical protein
MLCFAGHKRLLYCITNTSSTGALTYVCVMVFPCNGEHGIAAANPGHV